MLEAKYRFAFDVSRQVWNSQWRVIYSAFAMTIVCFTGFSVARTAS